MPYPKITMHPDAFNLAVSRGRFSGKSVEGARLMLVDGLTCTAAAAQIGLSHQAVNKATRRIRGLALGYGTCPCCGQAVT